MLIHMFINIILIVEPVGIGYFSLWMGCIFIDQWASNSYYNHKLHMKQMGCKKCLILWRGKARFGIFWMPF